MNKREGPDRPKLVEGTTADQIREALFTALQPLEGKPLGTELEAEVNRLGRAALQPFFTNFEKVVTEVKPARSFSEFTSRKFLNAAIIVNWHELTPGD